MIFWFVVVYDLNFVFSAKYVFKSLVLWNVGRQILRYYVKSYLCILQISLIERLIVILIRLRILFVISARSELQYYSHDIIRLCDSKCVVVQLGRVLYTIENITLIIYFQGLFSVLSALLVIGFITPFVLITILPLILVFLYLKKYYLLSSRELKRLEATSKIYN